MRAWAILHALKALGDVQTVVIPVAESGVRPHQNAAVHLLESPSPIDAAKSWLSYPRGRELLQQATGLPDRARRAAPFSGEHILSQSRNEAFDLVFVFRTYLAGVVLPLMEEMPNAVFVLDVDEVEHIVLLEIADFLEAGQNIESAAKMRREAVLSEKFASRVLPWFDAITCASPLESRNLRVHFDLSATTLPNVICLPGERPVIDAEQGITRHAPSLLFVGNLDYWPNRDACDRLITRIFPRVQDQVRDCELTIAGRGAEEMKKLCERNCAIKWLGFVEDLSSAYQVARICVIPLRAGGGSRLKILEAFAQGVPVVASAKAAEGLAVKNEVQLLLADGDEEISSAVLKIIKQPKLAFRLVNNGREFVNQYHTPKSMEDQMGRLIKNHLLL